MINFKSSPLFFMATVLSPPPTNFPLTKTLGTDLAPVLSNMMSWTLLPSAILSSSITSKSTPKSAQKKLWFRIFCFKKRIRVLKIKSSNKIYMQKCYLLLIVNFFNNHYNIKTNKSIQELVKYNNLFQRYT